jgi:tetratricopeptide (TPR) repeat protein
MKNTLQYSKQASALRPVSRFTLNACRLAIALAFGTMAIAHTSSTAFAATDATAEVKVEPSNDLTREILFQLLAAEIAQQRGQLGTAATTYLSLARSTRDSRLAKRATEIYLGERSFDGALQSSLLWVELAPESEAAASTLEALYLTSGRLNLAEPMLVKRLAKARQDRTLPEIYAGFERLLGRAPDRRASFDLIERISKPDLNVGAARAAIASLAANAGDFERASVEAQAALKLQPSFEPFAINAAVYTQQSKAGTKGAIEVVKPFVLANPKALEARTTYARLLSIDGQNDASKAELAKILNEDANNSTVLFSLAQVAVQLKQNVEAKKYLDQFIDLPRSVPRDNNSAYFFHAQIAEEENDPNKAIDWYSKVQRGERYMPSVMRRAALLGKTNRLADGRALLQSIAPTNARERQQLLSAEAGLLRQANQLEESFKFLDVELEKSPSNGDLLYEHGMAAERVNKLDVMEKSIKKLIQLEPNRAEAYNALGYSLADRNIRLPEAFQLIEKALQLAPESGAILDSMGWVLFRQNKLPEALEYLQKAYKLTPDAEVAVHIGEVLWKLGKTDEAKAMWRAAREKEPGSEVLKETLTRLNASL